MVEKLTPMPGWFGKCLEWAFLAYGKQLVVTQEVGVAIVSSPDTEHFAFPLMSTGVTWVFVVICTVCVPLLLQFQSGLTLMLAMPLAGLLWEDCNGLAAIAGGRG